MAIDVTVTSPFSAKRTTVVPLTAAKKMEVCKRRRRSTWKSAVRWWTAFSVLLLLRHMELQLMLRQQGMSLTLSSRRQRVCPSINWTASSPKAYWYQRLSLTLWATNAINVSKCFYHLPVTKCLSKITTTTTKFHTKQLTNNIRFDSTSSSLTL